MFVKVFGWMKKVYVRIGCKWGLLVLGDFGVVVCCVEKWFVKLGYKFGLCDGKFDKKICKVVRDF